MYQGPINIIENIQNAINESIDSQTLKAVLEVGIYVDKDELLKALAYDRGQYRKGYEDRDAEIIRCKDCKYGEQCVPPDDDRYCALYDQRHAMNWYCADGEVKQT